jgi:tRNA U34 5-methylaminomethyl-2-thiouridine-forming methyltransferase MnmC
MASEQYRIVKLVNGTHSVHSLSEAETFHPVVGPVAEAEELYVRQLNLVERVRHHTGEFVVWDVGLGAAANPVTFLRAIAGIEGFSVRILSFDHTLEPLRFALCNTQHLPYLKGFELPLQTLIEDKVVEFSPSEGSSVQWTVKLGDFPTFLGGDESRSWPKPHAIMFDAFSPAKNPAMWTLPVFSGIYRLLDPERPCALPTYSRSTMLRVTLLLAGFHVGVGHRIGEKEETTLAANTLELLREPLSKDWLRRVRRSTSAEPMREAVYRQAPLSEESWQLLARHPQFAERLW